MHAHEEREWKTHKTRIDGRLQCAGLGSLRKLAQWGTGATDASVISLLREKEEECGRVRHNTIGSFRSNIVQLRYGL